MPYARGDGYQAVEVSYWSDADSPGGFAFTAILPDEGRFEDIEAGMDADAFGAVIDHLDVTEVLLHMPRFEFTFSAEATSPLATMGMPDAFDPDLADFSGMVDGPPPEPLWIGAVLHKAFIHVDEKGTEAAASTVASMPGAAPPAEAPPEVRIDRPFLFAIRDTVSGTLLFLGRVMDPSS
jgi:serpin B